MVDQCPNIYDVSNCIFGILLCLLWFGIKKERDKEMFNFRLTKNKRFLSKQ